MIKTPVNQVKLTGVSVVRYKTKGQRFEIACYQNKVQDWRNKIETDLNEVLQIYEIFNNVSKGEFAKAKDVKKFLNSDKDKAIEIILEKGDLQVGKIERESEFDSLKNQIANKVSVMCVNKDTSVPFPVPIILKAMDDLNFAIRENHDAKKQALILMKQLPEVLPLERAKMRIKITCSNSVKVGEVKAIMSKKYDSEESKSETQLYMLEKEFNVGGQDGSSSDSKTELIYVIMPHLIKDIMNMCNKDDELTFEEIDHYVYSRLVSPEEEKEALKLYEESVKERQRKLDEEIDQPIIVAREETKSSGPMLMATDTSQDQIKCTTCNDAIFATKDEFKQHYKSEWHLENTKRKMGGKPKLNLDEFQIWREEQLDLEMFNMEKGNKNKGKKKGKKKNR